MMTYPWPSALALLLHVLAQVKGLHADSNVPPCAELHIATPVVLLGSTVSASCHITENCPLTQDSEFDVQFHYNNKLVEGTITANASSREFQIFISNVSKPSGLLTCSICTADCQVVTGLEIRAGFLPSRPQNLSCQMNLTSPLTLQCRWTPGADTHIPTTYTFHTFHNKAGRQWYNYSIPPGESHITIRRTQIPLYSKIQVHVRVENALGWAISPPLTLTPIDTVIFDPPRIERVQPVPGKYGCLMLHWSLQKDQTWMGAQRLQMEIRLKPTDSIVTDEEVLVQLERYNKPDLELCKLLHGTEYQAQMRVRLFRLNRSTTWSGWSNHASGTTLEKAPTGHLDTWLKVSEEQSQDFNRVELVWKPSKQFRANSRTISYTIFFLKKTFTKWICRTRERNCTFKIPKWVRKVYLTALNRVGKSKPTEVPVYTNSGLQPVSFLTVLPHGDSALLVQWGSPPLSSPTGYVLECRQQLDSGSSSVSFLLLDRNQSSAILSGVIEPYTPYEISVYPKYRDGVGLAHTVVAYSKEKAPSIAPIPKLNDIRHSHVDLSWDEIPVSKRNGIIQSYRVFYWDDTGDKEVHEVIATDKHVVLNDLKPLTMYQAFIMASTSAGSRNGSVVILETGSMDPFGVVLIGIPACAGLTLTFIIIMLTTVTKHKRLKKLFWPKIPDPANSSIRTWSTTELLQDSPPLKNSTEPALVFLSHFSVVDLTEKELEGLCQKDSAMDRWLCQDSDSDLYTCGPCQISSPFDLNGTSESIPYATLVFSGPYQSQPPPPPIPTYQPSEFIEPPPSPPIPVYQRSESTQPLLQEEEPQSPIPFSCMRPYQNVPMIQREDTDHGFSECKEPVGVNITQHHLWKDFPLLDSLEIKEV